MSEYSLEDLFLRNVTPETTVWNVAVWAAERDGLPVVEDALCPDGHVVFIYQGTRNTELAPGVYVNPSAKSITLRQNAAPLFDSTVKK